MNEIVRKLYPVAKLPDDLRIEAGNSQEVRITIEPLPLTPGGNEPMTQLLEEMQSHRVFSGDPVKRVRALRAEWEWRDELHDRIRAGDPS